MACKIVDIEYFLPEVVRSNADIEILFPDFKSDKIEKKIGISSRHISGKGETALDLAEKACEKLFTRNDRQEIDFLLLCTQSPDYFLPTSACVLQTRLKLRTDIGAFDFNLGCSGFVYGLSVAKGLIAGGIAKKVLLVTSETYSKHIGASDKANMSLFGDGAAAAIIAKNESEDIGNFCLGTDGSGFQNLIVANGAMRSERDGSEKDFLYMDGPEIFNFTIGAVPKLVQDTLAKNQLKLDDIDMFLFHQANKYMLDYLRTKCEIPAERFFVDMKDIGNTVSASIPIALCKMQEKQVVRNGDRVMLVGFGVGYSYGATVIRLNFSEKRKNADNRC